MRLNGQCLCGKVKIAIEIEKENIGTCHCTMCRQWAGGPWMVVEAKGDVKFDGKDFLKIFESSAWGERGFCTECGSNLFYRLKLNGQYFVNANLFEKAVDHFQFDHELFIESKPHYYEFKNDTKKITGEQLFKMFGA